MKGRDESFSDVILKIGKNVPVKSLLGILPRGGYESSKRRLKELREKISKDIEGRIHDITR